MNLPELAQQFKDLKAKVENFFSKSTNAEQAEAFKAELDGIGSKLEAAKQLEADLATARATISTLSAQVKDFETKSAAHIDELAAKEKSVEERAAAKAATIAASQGIDPVIVKPTNPVTGASSNSIDELNKQAAAEKDPTKKWALLQQIKKLRGL